MSAILTAESVVEDCDVLSQLEVRKNRAVYEPTDLNFGTPLEARYLPGQYDLLCKIGDTVYPPAFRRVTEHWQLRQPKELLDAMGFDKFSNEWGFRHVETRLMYENKRKGETPSVTGVRLFFEADLEERYTENVGPHSIRFSVALSWNGMASDKIRVWLVDRWCSNGMTSRTGLYSVNVNHSKNLTDYVDKARIYAAISEHLEWKVSLADIQLGRPIEAEVIRLLEHDNQRIKDFDKFGKDNPRLRYLDLNIASLCHEDNEFFRPLRTDPDLSQSMRVLTWDTPTTDRLPTVDAQPPAVSRRRLTQVGEAVSQESERSTWTGRNMLDLSNVLTRIYCQDDKVLTKTLETQFNQLVKSYN